MKILVTGSGGLIGSEACRYFAGLGNNIVGIDNDYRKYYFGDEGSTVANLKKLSDKLKAQYHHYSCDIRNAKEINQIFKDEKPDAVIHTAAQPSHDWAAKEPFTDFSVNAT